MADGDFIEMLDSLDDRLRAAEPAALGKGAEHVRSVAAPLTPKDTGNLVGSASVVVTPGEADIIYPGPYARNQHYTLDFRHTTGQALYLEQPMITEAAKVLKIVANTLGEAF